MAADVSFPLLQLPIDELSHAIRLMEIIDLLKLSFLSRRSKNHVTSLNLKADPIRLHLHRSLNIRCRFNHVSFHCFFKMKHKDGVPTIVKKPGTIYFRDPVTSTLYSWNSTKYSKIRDWLDHIATIFHEKNPRIDFDANASRFDFDWIYEQFKNPSHLYVDHTGCAEYNKKVLKILKPTEKLVAWFDCFENQRAPQSILNQNLDDLVLLCEVGREKELFLNDLLCCNSKKLSLRQVVFSQKSINTFIKLWILGSNPRLELFSIKFFPREVINYETILKRIRFEFVPEDRIRSLEFYSGEMYSMRGGRDIWRLDGTKATVFICGHFPRQCFVFSVWHDS